MRTLFIVVAKSLFNIARIIQADGYDITDYGKLPATDPKRLTSPKNQRSSLHELLNTPPFDGEWINKNILSGFFKMGNSPSFIKKFPQVANLSKLITIKSISMFRDALSSLTDADVQNDYSYVNDIATESRKLLARIKETLYKVPSSIDGLGLWIEELQKLAEAFSTVLNEGIEEVKHLKTSAIKTNK